jgi:hypothetical protein
MEPSSKEGKHGSFRTLCMLASRSAAILEKENREAVPTLESISL